MISWLVFFSPPSSAFRFCFSIVSFRGVEVWGIYQITVTYLQFYAITFSGVDHIWWEFNSAFAGSFCKLRANLHLRPFKSPSNMEEAGDKPTTTQSSIKSGVDSLDSHSYGKQLEEIRISNTQPSTSIQTGVDVTAAEKDFLELNRQFSSISHQAHRLSYQASRVSKNGTTTQDVEKAEGSTQSDDSWDLETSLRGDRVAAVEAGIKDKHIG